ncbi:MAG: hypothetical protein AB1749_15940 [Pseudomonadota bacterium]
MKPDFRDSATQTREAELRERVHRLGFELRRSPVSDPSHPSYGRYEIVDAPHHIVVAGYDPFAFSLDLDAVAEWVNAATPGH